MPSYQLFKRNRDWLRGVYKGRNRQIEKHLVVTLAMMVTGVLLGPHVQLFAIAMCVPCDVKLTSIVRRFERFVADERVDVQVFFAPFVRAMQLIGLWTIYGLRFVS